MKTNKYCFMGIGIFIGIFISISLMALFSFTKGVENSASRDGISPISSTQAHNYFKNYISKAENFNQVIKGFMVDRAQLSAMNAIASENSALTGFRIYNGKDDNSTKIGIVVGIESNGKDAMNNSIYNTDSPNSAPCPILCDLNSPIIGDN